MEEKSLRDEIRDLKETLRPITEKESKPKKFRIPMKGRVGKANVRKGYATILELKENKQTDFSRQKIEDNCIKITDSKGKQYYSLDDPENEVFFYKGKPLIILDRKRMNPYNQVRDYSNGKNEVYWEEYVINKMEADYIKAKKSISNWWLLIGGLVLIALVIYAVFTGGGQ